MLWFSVCVVNGIKAEAGSDEDKVFSHYKLMWSNSRSKCVMSQMHFSSCWWMWSSAMYKSKGLRMAAWVQCWSEVGKGFFWLPTLGVRVSVVSPTSLLRTGVPVRLLKGNLSTIQHMDTSEWTLWTWTTIWYAIEKDLEEHKDMKLLLSGINCSSFRQLSNNWHLPGKIWQIWTGNHLV